MRASVATFIAVALVLARVGAFPRFVSLVPNGAAVAGVRAIGHRNFVGGGALNPFGEAFDAAGQAWTAALCQADSDGDGATNGAELGDPCCVWSPSSGSMQLRQQVSHPGVVNSFTQQQLLMLACQQVAPDPRAAGNGGIAASEVTPPAQASEEVTPPATTGNTTASIGSASSDAIYSIDPAVNVRQTPPSLVPDTPAPMETPEPSGHAVPTSSTPAVASSASESFRCYTHTFGIVVFVTTAIVFAGVPF